MRISKLTSAVRDAPHYLCVTKLFECHVLPPSLSYTLCTLKNPQIFLVIKYLNDSPTSAAISKTALRLRKAIKDGQISTCEAVQEYLVCSKEQIISTLIGALKTEFPYLLAQICKLSCAEYVSRISLMITSLEKSMNSQNRGGTFSKTMKEKFTRILELKELDDENTSKFRILLKTSNGMTDEGSQKQNQQVEKRLFRLAVSPLLLRMPKKQTVG